MPYNPKGFNDVGGDATMAPSELQPPLNFADGGAVGWAGDTTVYNTQSQIGNMLATPGGFSGMSKQFTEPSSMAMAEGGSVDGLAYRLAHEFSKRGLDMNKMIAHRKAYAYGGDVRGGDNPGGLRGDTGAYSGRSIGSSQSINAAMGRESPAQRDVSYTGNGGGSDRGGGREAPAYVSPTSDITTANLNAQRAAQEVIAPAAPATIDVFAPAPATTKFGNMNAPFAPGVVPTGIFTPTQAQINETYRPSDYAGRGLKVEQPGQRASALTGLATAPLSFTPLEKTHVPDSPTSQIESYTKNVLRPAATAAQQKSELEAMAEKMRQQAGLQPPTQDVPLPVERPKEPIQYAGRGEVVEQPGERKTAYEQVLAQVVKPNIPLPPIPDRPAMSEAVSSANEDIASEMFKEPKQEVKPQFVATATKRPPAPIATTTPATQATDQGILSKIMADINNANAKRIAELEKAGEFAGGSKTDVAAALKVDPSQLQSRIVNYDGRQKVDYFTKGLDQVLGDIVSGPFKAIGNLFGPNVNNLPRGSSVRDPRFSDLFTQNVPSTGYGPYGDLTYEQYRQQYGGGNAQAPVAAPVQTAAVTPAVTTPVSPALPQALASFKRKYVPLTNYANYGYGPEGTFYEYTAAEGGPVGPLSQKRK